MGLGQMMWPDFHCQNHPTKMAAATDDAKLDSKALMKLCLSCQEDLRRLLMTQAINSLWVERPKEMKLLKGHR